MGKKVFVSYKYADNDVRKITDDYYHVDTVRDYVNYLEKIIGNGNIYKGEHDGEDLSKFKDETIWSSLKDKIFDSSVTIVLISKNMKESLTLESEQWIPQEVSYSLKEMTRNNYERKSLSNAILCVVIPDMNGLYNYYIDNNKPLFPYNNSITFKIIENNMNNNKNNLLDSYIVTAKWDEFIKDINYYINKAVEKQNNINLYNITKQI